MRKGIIYSIKSLNSNLIYIGSSKQSLASRKAKHVYDSKNLCFIYTKKNIDDYNHNPDLN